MAPTHSWDYLAPPSAINRPIRNAWHYDGEWDYIDMPPYSTASTEIDADMGIIPQYILNTPNSVRGNSPICSFTALGDKAHALCDSQKAMDVTAPLKELAAQNGTVICFGVDLTKVTLLHYAEQLSGRKPFLRWSLSPENDIIPVQVGGCSEGFNTLLPLIENCIETGLIGEAEYMIFKARPVLEKITAAIKQNPELTRCSAKCPVCADSIAGGPIY